MTERSEADQTTLQERGRQSVLQSDQKRAQKTKTSNRSKAVMMSLVAIALVAFIVIGAPLLAKSQAEKYLSQLLQDKVTIGAVTLNPFNGKAEVRDLRTQSNTKLDRLAIDLVMTSLGQRKLVVQSVELSGLVLPITLQSAGVSIAGVDFAALLNDANEVDNAANHTADVSPGWQVSIAQATVSQSRVDISFVDSNELASDHFLNLNSVVVENYNSEAPQGITVSGALVLNGTEVNLNGLVDQLAEDEGVISGSIEVNDFALERYATVLGSVMSEDEDLVQYLGNLKGRVDINHDFTINAAKGAVVIDSGGRIKLEKLTSKAAGLESLVHTGSFSLRISQQQLEGFTTNGQWQLNKLAIPKLVDLGFLDWRGEAELSAKGALGLTGDLILKQISAAPMGVLGEIEATNIDFTLADQNSFAAKLIRIAGSDLILEMAKDGQFVLPFQSFAEAPNPAESERPDAQNLSTEKPDAQGFEAWNLTIEEVVLESNRLEFIDRSVEPLVDLALDNITAQVSGLSLVNPFTFALQMNHQAASDLEAWIEIDGEVGLKDRNGYLDVDLKQFELHEIAPYLGSGVKSGRLNLVSKIKMKNGRMKLANNVYIKNVKIDERTQGSSEQMSLSTALFLLKDKNDVVELDVPFETDFDNFEIGFSDIIQTAMIKAAQTTAIAYAQYALQPYGSLLLAKNVLGAVTRPKFEPILFEPTQSTLSGRDAAYVAKLADFLRQKTELSVTVCGYAQTQEILALREQRLEDNRAEVTPADDGTKARTSSGAGETSAAETSAVEPSADEIIELRKLAQDRSLFVKTKLLEAGIASERLYACSAAVETKDKAPRVELAL